MIKNRAVYLAALATCILLSISHASQASKTSAIVPTNTLLLSDDDNVPTAELLSLDRVRGHAPLAVFADATADTDFHQDQYRWQHAAIGPLSAIVVEQPGETMVRVDVTNDAGTRRSSVTVTALAWDETVCVSPNGNFEGCPVGATQQTSSNPSALLATGRRVLLQRGVMWSGNLEVNDPGPGHVGAYGEGSKPIFTGALRVRDVADWRITDLEFRATTDIGGSNVRDVLLQRVTIRGAGSCGIAQGVPMLQGIFLVDVECLDLNGSGGGWAWYMLVERSAVLRTVWEGSDSVGGNLRFQHGADIVIADSDFRGAGSGKANVTFRACNVKPADRQDPGCTRDRVAGRVVMVNNRIEAGGNLALVGINGADPTHGAGPNEDYLFEDNDFIAPAGSERTILNVGEQYATRITIRNNRVESVPKVDFVTGGGSPTWTTGNTVRAGGVRLCWQASSVTGTCSNNTAIATAGGVLVEGRATHASEQVGNQLLRE